MRKVYEAWQGDAGCSITFAPVENIQQQRANGLLPEDARLLYRVEADTWEEAMAVHYIKMGWSPYVPEGEPKECPRGCGAMFYPQGSGECPNCGRIC
jgi:hypothetical protein